MTCRKTDLIVFISIISFLVFAGFASAEPTIQDFDSAGTSYTLSNYLGDSAIIESGGLTGKFVQLVNGFTQNQLNTIAFDATFSENCKQVIADFDFRIISMARFNGDGFGFSLLNIYYFGSVGNGPQFSEEPNLSNSLGIGFDIYKNKGSGDPDGNHLSLHFDGATIAAFPIRQLVLGNGFTCHAHIVVNFYKGTVTVTFTPIGGYSFSPIDDYAIPGLVPYASRVAFGARTGGVTASHHLDNIRVQFLHMD